MFERFFTADQIRKKLLKKTNPGPIASYLEKPFVPPNSKLNQIEFLSLDLEATGLDLQQDEILSVGFTVIRNMSVILSESNYFLVRPKQAIPEESAIIHRIFDDESSQGIELEDALLKILQALQGRVLLAHHANIECGFLNKACQKVFNSKIIFPLVDTFAIEYKSLKHRGVTPYNQSLRLAALREDYNLPRYPAHNALSDAIATAELFIAQIAHRSGNDAMKLSDVFSRC
ncbi:MAG TPA: exonuclease domain-containing protein [Gammaproteobacteria bacterium]